ncbi:hypothetical protein ONZ43_g2557 [Nemania bipapillata]|uniref:Uncharacterized protein n=1 Tax=Nemania bipapillata TaxID=110536 RepID=A0ACC2J077_9PEZI|nr:hypothetical protein ONZ43_g2557 [Nemania bipapillata]
MAMAVCVIDDRLTSNFGHRDGRENHGSGEEADHEASTVGMDWDTTSDALWQPPIEQVPGFDVGEIDLVDMQDVLDNYNEDPDWEGPFTNNNGA